MQKAWLAIPVLAAGTFAFAGTHATLCWVFASGSGTGSDRGSAVSEATEGASRQARSICAGAVVEVEPTGSVCAGGGDIPYACTVTVKAVCQVNGR